MMMFSWLLFLVGGAWLAAWLLQRDRRQMMDTGVGLGPPATRDMDILRERYARGEITREQYEEMREDLRR